MRYFRYFMLGWSLFAAGLSIIAGSLPLLAANTMFFALWVYWIAEDA